MVLILFKNKKACPHLLYNMVIRTPAPEQLTFLLSRTTIYIKLAHTYTYDILLCLVGYHNNMCLYRLISQISVSPTVHMDLEPLSGCMDRRG